MDEIQIRNLPSNDRKFVYLAERSGDFARDRGQFHFPVCSSMRLSRDAFQLSGAGEDS